MKLDRLHVFLLLALLFTLFLVDVELFSERVSSVVGYSDKADTSPLPASAPDLASLMANLEALPPGIGVSLAQKKAVPYHFEQPVQRKKLRVCLGLCIMPKCSHFLHLVRRTSNPRNFSSTGVPEPVSSTGRDSKASGCPCCPSCLTSHAERAGSHVPSDAGPPLVSHL